MADVLMLESAVVAAGRPPRPAVNASPRFSIVTQGHSLWPSMRPLRDALETAGEGDCVAFAVPLDTPLFRRLITLVAFRWLRRRAERVMRKSGAVVVAQYGVEPSLTQPSCFYELDTPASEYVDRCMRPRGSALALRRAAGRWLGCDPALGGVLVVGKKACS